jgi:hypothetical protein
MGGVGEVAVRDKRSRETADLAPAHRIRLSRQAEGPGAGAADVAGGEVQVDEPGVLGGAARGLVEPLAVERERGARAANQRAAVTMSSARTPQVSAAACGVLAHHVAQRLEARGVRAMYGSSTSFSHSITCSIAWKSATSVPGRIARCRSAKRAVSVRRGSTTIFSSGAQASPPRCGGRAPGGERRVGAAMKRHSAWSMSS